jgi:hypothetical protein
MSDRTPDWSGLLKWYPSRWRSRYGDEFTAMMEDSLDGRPASRRFRASIAWAGLRERGHETGLFGDSVPAGDRIRAASRHVLFTWSAFIVAGGNFAKVSENFDLVVPPRSHVLSAASYYTVFVGAVVGGLLVLAGAAIAIPAFARFLRSGGWPSVRGHILRAGAATVVAVAATTALVVLAHTLSPAQRNGELLYHPVVGYYLAAFVATMLLLLLTLALWTAAAVAVTRRLALAESVISAEAWLAVALAAVMILMTAATTVWWAATGSSAPWFVQGTLPGSPASAFDPNLVATLALMVLASAAASFGVVRMARAWKALRLG